MNTSLYARAKTPVFERSEKDTSTTTLRRLVVQTASLESKIAEDVYAQMWLFKGFFRNAQKQEFLREPPWTDLRRFRKKPLNGHMIEGGFSYPELTCNK